jgi:hypothetical protein
MKLKRIQKLKQDGRLENVPKLGTKNPNYGKNEREGQDAKRNCSKVQKSSKQEGKTGATRMLQRLCGVRFQTSPHFGDGKPKSIQPNQ